MTHIAGPERLKLETAAFGPSNAVLLCAAAMLAFSAVKCGAQTPISNVNAQQRPGTVLVDITYDLSTNSGVDVAISSNAGLSYEVPASSLSGDVGPEVNAGAGRKITWDAGKDWPGNFSTDMIVELRPMPGPLDELAIITKQLPGGAVNDPYSSRLLATRGSPPYLWTISTGSLPPGLTLSNSGEIAGWPTQTGAYTFVAMVVDATESASIAREFTISIGPAPPLQIVAPDVFPQGYWNEPWSEVDGLKVYVKGGAPPYTLSASGDLTLMLGYQADTSNPRGGAGRFLLLYRHPVFWALNSIGDSDRWLASTRRNPGSEVVWTGTMRATDSTGAVVTKPVSLSAKYDTEKYARFFPVETSISTVGYRHKWFLKSQSNNYKLFEIQ